MPYYPLRTALFVPGTRPDRVDKALATQADAVIIDLEDAVPLEQKEAARKNAAAKLQEHANRALIVRSNTLDSELFAGDLEAVVAAGGRALLVPKMETAAQVGLLEHELSKAEARHGLEPGRVGVLFLIETALAVQNIFEIASQGARLTRPALAAFGAADYSADLGINLSASGEELLYPRARICVACRAAGMEPPIDTPFMLDLKDLEALAEDAGRAKQMGFAGKLCIHPNQVEICNRIFSPTREEIEFAHKIITSFEEAKQSGQGALQVDGKFVDEPIVKRCRRTLNIARAMEKKTGGEHM